MRLISTGSCIDDYVKKYDINESFIFISMTVKKVSLTFVYALHMGLGVRVGKVREITAMYTR